MNKFEEGRTTRDLAIAVGDAIRELNPGTNLGRQHILYEKMAQAKVKARANAGEAWKISRDNGPKRGSEIAYSVDYVLEIMGEFMKIAVAASSDFYIPHHLQRVKRAGITPEAVRLAEVLLYEPKKEKEKQPVQKIQHPKKSFWSRRVKKVR